MELKQFLDKLGLSQYEKQAYLALLRLGRTKSKELSKESNVSYGRIYEILDKLEERGLVSSLPTTPKTFEAINPKISFKRILNKKTEELTKLKKEIKQLKLPSKKMPAKFEDRTSVIHGKQKQIQLINELKERATKEILSIPGTYEAKTPTKVASHRALQRGVKIRRLLRAVTPDNKLRVKENLKLGEQIRQKTLTGLRLQIIDKKEAIISIVEPKTKNRISIHTTNKDFASSMAIFFESLWETSKPIF